jgi:hypothetical protein
MSTSNESSSTKQAVLDRLATEQAAWDALVAEVDPAWAGEPNAMGAWSFKDVAAHIAGWRQAFVNDVVAAVQGTPPPSLGWPYTHEKTEEETPEGDAKTQAVNDWLFAQSRPRTYDQVLAEAALQWTTLRAAVALMPDDLIERGDAIASLGGQSLAEILLGEVAFPHFHEEHEPEIRQWLATRRDVRPIDGDEPPTCANCGGVIAQEDVVCPHCGVSLVAG